MGEGRIPGERGTPSLSACDASLANGACVNCEIPPLPLPPLSNARLGCICGPDGGNESSLSGSWVLELSWRNSKGSEAGSPTNALCPAPVKRG